MTCAHLLVDERSWLCYMLKPLGASPTDMCPKHVLQALHLRPHFMHQFSTSAFWPGAPVKCRAGDFTFLALLQMTAPSNQTRASGTYYACVSAVDGVCCVEIDCLSTCFVSNARCWPDDS
jgi:hypothetical protein